MKMKENALVSLLLIFQLLLVDTSETGRLQLKEPTNVKSSPSCALQQLPSKSAVCTHWPNSNVLNKEVIY